VIQDVDDTLKALLVQKVPLDTSVIDIKFEMPTHDWSTKVSKPTVNLYLYDIRENLELRSSDRYLTRNADNTGSQRRAPVRVDLSYLISVWTTDISDEHQLLGQILTALLQFPMLPDDVLQGSMQTQLLPLQAWIARPERMPNPWDFWGHVENRMKSGLNYVVTASLEPYPVEAVKLVTQTVTGVKEITS
jgi:hypothetical protein